MSLPATTHLAPWTGHAASFRLSTDVIPDVNIIAVANYRAKSVRLDNEGLRAQHAPSWTGSVKAVRTDKCNFDPVTCDAAWVGRVLGIMVPFTPVRHFADLQANIEPLVEPEGAWTEPAHATWEVHSIARVTFNNPNLNCTDLARQVYYMWGYQTKDIKSIGIGLDSIAMWANTAMQLIFSRADKLDFFNREPLTLTVTATGKVDLPSGLQRIQGPVTVTATGKTLRPLASRGEMHQFTTRFMGDASSPPAYPLAYWCEATRSAGAESVAAALHLVPAPQADVEISLDVTLEPPRYSEADLLYGRVIEIPQKWAETLLLPLVKKWALGDPIMPASSREAMQPQIDQQYATALRTLELADPSAPAVTQSKPVEAAEASK